jgi:hypothetical protein
MQCVGFSDKQMTHRLSVETADANSDAGADADAAFVEGAPPLSTLLVFFS